MVSIPSGLDWLRSSARGAAWLESLPAVVGSCVGQWSLTVGDPYPGGYTSLVVPAETATGDRAVLKIQFPDRESEHEAAALAVWHGRGAVRLLDHDPSRRALLIERCEPGRPLSASGPEVALDVLVGLLPDLMIPAPVEIASLAAEAARWAESLPHEWELAGRPFDRWLVDAGLEALTDLAPTQSTQVLVHQDLHGGNVLSAERSPWLVIDPKPLSGEREFGVAPIVRSSELGATESDVLYRLDRLCDELDLEHDRARLWTLAQTLSWSFENNKALDWHVQVARWLV